MLILVAKYAAPKKGKAPTDEEPEAAYVEESERKMPSMMFFAFGGESKKSDDDSTKTIRIACRFFDAGFRKAVALLPKGGRLISIQAEYNVAEADDVTPEGFLAACQQALNANVDRSLRPEVAAMLHGVVAGAKAVRS